MFANNTDRVVTIGLFVVVPLVALTVRGLLSGQQLREQSPERNEAAAVAALGLIDDDLMNETKHGYVFESGPSTTSPELWFWAVASPTRPGETGTKWFFVNHESAIYYSHEPFEVDRDSCDVPAGLERVER